MSVLFTSKEQAVLNQLLNAETSLTASEIVARSESLNSNTVQSVVRSLLKRGYIEVAQIVYSGKVLCRSYRPTEKAKNAAFEDLSARFRFLRKNMPAPKIFAGLIDSEEDQQAVIEELETMLAQKRELLTREGK